MPLTHKVSSRAKFGSRYKRLQRFFSKFKFDYGEIAMWIYKLFFTGDKVYLVMDRTDWFLGKTKINILTLGITNKGVAIPLLWKLLNKAGNASAKEPKNILNKFVKLFGNKRIAGVLADSRKQH